ncbi:hypothetical protein CC78DRAFT_578857 [Lojkania enalia]|uniref:Uncharacterized protein n=1 Tax=Lojkania enalia TaxID=147567 RepID=A0A9P4KB38_9PLEO|nr:hypothetical protein CC78DRAFT_578857 [Didymosphaeria enalia]
MAHLLNRINYKESGSEEDGLVGVRLAPKKFNNSETDLSSPTELSEEADFEASIGLEKEESENSSSPAPRLDSLFRVQRRALEDSLVLVELAVVSPVHVLAEDVYLAKTISTGRAIALTLAETLTAATWTVEVESYKRDHEPPALSKHRKVITNSNASFHAEDGAPHPWASAISSIRFNGPRRNPRREFHRLAGLDDEDEEEFLGQQSGREEREAYLLIGVGLGMDLSEICLRIGAVDSNVMIQATIRNSRYDDWTTRSYDHWHSKRKATWDENNIEIYRSRSAHLAVDIKKFPNSDNALGLPRTAKYAIEHLEQLWYYPYNYDRLLREIGGPRLVKAENTNHEPGQQIKGTANGRLMMLSDLDDVVSRTARDPNLRGRFDPFSAHAFPGSARKSPPQWYLANITVPTEDDYNPWAENVGWESQQWLAMGIWVGMRA